jgi:hypothetical protein
VFAALVALAVRIDEPLMYSSLASTAAIAFHRPRVFIDDWWTVLGTYVAASAATGALGVIGVYTSAPQLLWMTIAALMVAFSGAGRVHPPAVCLPFAIPAVTTLEGFADSLVAALLAGATLLVALRLIFDRGPRS